jgi:hypothetical protein
MIRNLTELTFRELTGPETVVSIGCELHLLESIAIDDLYFTVLKFWGLAGPERIISLGYQLHLQKFLLK